MKRAFTLIELLVVIAIIAILAAILFPVFAQAKLAAKKSADLSNTKQLGTATYLYLNDNDDQYMSAYFYNNGANGNNGVYAWSAALLPYVKSAGIFVSPGAKNGGWAPANFTGDNSGAGYPSPQIPGTIQDNQVPRISYTGNLLVLPRKRKPSDNANTVTATSIDSVAETIVIAPQTDDANCLVTSSTVYKSYRTGAAVSGLGQAIFDGSEDPSSFAALEAMTKAGADATFYGPAGCIETKGYNGTNNSSVRFIAPNRFGNGGNYVFADDHAKFVPFEKTLDPEHYLWGKAAYSFEGKPIYKPGTTTNVN
ncbi:hypothetical protein BH11ARM2_BH11ARM2_22570 [soil metagenome]